MRRPWFAIVALWSLGVLAAAQLSKLSVIAPLLQQRFELPLPALGLLISLLEFGGASLGLVAGLALGRVGCRRFLIVGVAVLCACGIVEAMTTAYATLFFARAIEGLGYLFVVIAAPTSIVTLANDAIRPRALALWSTFVPVGAALGGIITGLLVGVMGERGVLLFWAMAMAGGLLLAMRLPVASNRAGRIALPAFSAWVSTFAFGILTLFTCVLIMLLPLFLVERCSASIRDAGFVTATVSLTTLAGSALATFLTRRGTPNPRRYMVLCLIALATTATVAPFIFLKAGASGSMLTVATLSSLALAASSVVPPMLLARLPIHAGAKTSSDPRIATSYGLITQFGAGGALVGPPLGGLIVGTWGWSALGFAVSSMTLAMFVGIVVSESVRSIALVDTELDGLRTTDRTTPS